MKETRGESKTRWLAIPATPAEAELREALDQAAAREADEVALRRVWARLAELPALGSLAHFYDGQDGDRDDGHGRGQMDDARTRRVRWPWIVAASLAGATATLAFMLIETKSEFRVGRGEQAQIAEPGNGTVTSGGIDAGQRSTLVAPATVRTGFGETLHLSLRGGTEVVVTSESTLVLDQNDRPAVSSGEVQFHVPHQVMGQTFSVGAGAYRVVVVGTRFRVRVNQSSAAVGVDEGVVEVWTDHRIARLSAGESWVSPDRALELGTTRTGVGPQPRSQPQTQVSGTRASTKNSPKNSRNSFKASLNFTRANPSATSPAGPVVSGESVRSTNTSGSSVPAAWSSPGKSNAVRANLALNTPSPVSGGSSSGTYAESATPRARVEPAAPTVLGPTPTVAAAPPTDFAALALQARAARFSGDSRRALGLYRALAQKGGPAGENAEYEIGRVLRDGLHQPREAVAVWRAYRAQHPRGLLRIEADISLIETLTSMGDKTGAMGEASDFVRRYPDSERRSEIARLAGDLHRERGECVEAVRAYDIALGSGHSRREISDSASFHRSICLLQDNRSEGSGALRAYLSAFPSGHFHAEAQRLLKASPAASPSAATSR